MKKTKPVKMWATIDRHNRICDVAAHTAELPDYFTVIRVMVKPIKRKSKKKA